MSTANGGFQLVTCELDVGAVSDCYGASNQERPPCSLERPRLRRRADDLAA
jgi:predicted lipoprotein with Yx(FWY)xxD motif